MSRIKTFDRGDTHYYVPLPGSIRHTTCSPTTCSFFSPNDVQGSGDDSVDHDFDPTF